MKSQDSATYQALLKQVEKIVADINGTSAGELDLDLLVQKIEQGYDIIRALRARLDDIKMKVENLREALEVTE